MLNNGHRNRESPHRSHIIISCMLYVTYNISQPQRLKIFVWLVCGLHRRTYKCTPIHHLLLIDHFFPLTGPLEQRFTQKHTYLREAKTAYITHFVENKKKSISGFSAVAQILPWSSSVFDQDSHLFFHNFPSYSFQEKSVLSALVSFNFQLGTT